MPRITVCIDVEKDASNYWGAIHRNTHSSSWKDQLKNIDFDFGVLEKVSQEEAYSVLKPYLDKYRTDHQQVAEKKQQEMQEVFDAIGEQIFQRMEQVTKHPIYRPDFTIFLTSLNRGPYHVEKGYTRSAVFRSGFVSAFIHELLHFQTIYYYKKSMMAVLQNEKVFEDIKEALTFLLNHEFSDIITSPYLGYPQHQELRKKLENYRVSSNKDFEELLRFSLTCI